MKSKIQILVLILLAMRFAETHAQLPVFNKPAAPAPAAPAQGQPAPAQPAPATPQEIAAIPDCKSGKFSSDWREIDKSLKEVTGYQRAFNKDFDLEESPVTGLNACHAGIKWNDQFKRPFIGIEDCAFSYAAKPVKACQNGNRIRFVEDTSVNTGQKFSGTPMIMEWQKVSDTHWMVLSNAIDGVGMKKIDGMGFATVRERQRGTAAH